MRTPITLQSPDTNPSTNQPIVSFHCLPPNTHLVHQKYSGTFQNGAGHAKQLLLASRARIPSKSAHSSTQGRDRESHPVEKFSPPSETGESRLRNTLAFTPSSSSETSFGGMRCTRRRASYCTRPVSPARVGYAASANTYNLRVLVFVEDIQRGPECSAQDGGVLCRRCLSVIRPRDSAETELTRDDGELAPQIGQANLGNVQAVDEDAPFGRFHEAEERQREGALPRSRSTQNTDFLTRANLKRQMVQDVWQFRLPNSTRCSSGSIPEGKGERAGGRTAYRMTRSSHLIAPVVGHDAGGRGSTNSGGSRGSSENSLTRSTATCRKRLGRSQQRRGGAFSPWTVRDRRTDGPASKLVIGWPGAGPAYKTHQEEKLEKSPGQLRSRKRTSRHSRRSRGNSRRPAQIRPVRHQLSGSRQQRRP